MAEQRARYTSLFGRRALATAIVGMILAVFADAPAMADRLPTYGAPSPTATAGGVDTALVVSVDVSSSVDERRYRLQLEGIAAALEDPAVVSAIVGGVRGGILLSLVTWADRPKLALPWMRIASREDAAVAALKIRALPREPGDFTCLSGMLRFVTDKLIPQVPEPALKIVVDVSGDGSDNCNAEQPPREVRDEMASRGTTINGLPILEGREAATLEGWYKANVMGGPGAFILPAQGFEDFGRAIRQKFVIEISGAPLRSTTASAADFASETGMPLKTDAERPTQTLPAATLRREPVGGLRISP